jgi:pseudouridine synthase
LRERLQKILARAGIASRRACEELIAAGHVRLNGERVTTLGLTADPDVDRIEFDGRLLPKPPRPRVILLNKPVGYLSTSRVVREAGRSVLELVPSDRRYFTVGRLDRDSSGLLLLTDDGDLAFRLTHPRHGTRKYYDVETTRRLTDDELERLRIGVSLEDGLARAMEVRRLSGNHIKLVLAEGRNREIRRMMRVIDARVRTLHRTGIGTLRLGDLPLGHWRELAAGEVAGLRASAVDSHL